MYKIRIFILLFSGTQVSEYANWDDSIDRANYASLWFELSFYVNLLK